MVYAVKTHGSYYIAYEEDSLYIYCKNLFPEIAGIKAIRIAKNEDKEIVKIKTKHNEKGEIEYIHPEL